MDHPPPHITIRPAQAQDQPDLERIAAAAYRQYVPVMGKKPAPMLADYGHHLAHDTVFVAERGGNVLGYAILISKKTGWWLENIAVAPDHAGQGIGRLLLGHLEDCLAGHAGYYQLYTNRLMARNIGGYRRMGFEETHRRTEDGYERVFFRKSLTRT